jgi:hypothetical protein
MTINSIEFKNTCELCSDGKLSDIVVLNPELTPDEWLECACIADKNSHVDIIEHILEYRLDDFGLMSLFGQACSQGLNIIRDICLRDHLDRLKSANVFALVSLTFGCCLVNEHFDTCDLLLKHFGDNIDINLYLARNNNNFKNVLHVSTIKNEFELMSSEPFSFLLSIALRQQGSIDFCLNIF